MLLLAYDGSEDARSAIQKAAELFPGASLMVLTVWEPFSEVIAHSGAGVGLAPGLIDYDEIDTASQKTSAERANEGVELAKQAGLDAQPKVVAQVSTTAAAILREASELNAQAVIVGSRGLTGIKSILLGSVSHAVLHHADRPVVVITSDAVIKERAAHEHE